MKELEKYLGATYIDIFHLAIMTETASTFPDPYILTITDLGIELQKKDGEMTFLEKNNINEAIRQKMMNKDFYES